MKQSSGGNKAKKQVRPPKQAKLVLEDGSEYLGWHFGKSKSAAGEVVFNTGMSGLIQALTDPGYCGQIFVSSFPLSGNIGSPAAKNGSTPFDENGLPVYLESDNIQVGGLIVSEVSMEASHYSSKLNLSSWLEKKNVPGIYGIDTRALTIRLRERGSMRGKILVEGKNDVTLGSCILSNPFNVTTHKLKTYGSSQIKIALIDLGVKANIIRCLLARNVEVIRIPYNQNIDQVEYDGLFLSNGPGNPKECEKTTEMVRLAMATGKPIFGVGLGSLIIALAAGADTCKLVNGHRGQNHPCTEVGTKRCYITTQNHSYTIVKDSIPGGWESWFTNLNDGSIEGIRCKDKPFSAVQFYPEGCPGPSDTEFLFDRFITQIMETKR